MTLLIPEVLGLGLGMIMSPGLLAVTIFLLGREKNNLKRACFFLLGNILTLAILICLGFFIGTNLNSNPQASFHKGLDFLIGIIFIFFGVKALLSKERKIKESKSPKIFLWFILGFAFSITNLDADTLFIVAMREIFHSGILILQRILLITYCSLMILLPVILPIFVYCIFPQKSKKILEKIDKPVKKYGKYFIVAIFILFGILFLLKGFGILA